MVGASRGKMLLIKYIRATGGQESYRTYYRSRIHVEKRPQTSIVAIGSIQGVPRVLRTMETTRL